MDRIVTVNARGLPVAVPLIAKVPLITPRSVEAVKFIFPVNVPGVVSVKVKLRDVIKKVPLSSGSPQLNKVIGILPLPV